MASGFFAILDDIAALMDDVAVTAKVASRQTAGILGDDLAVNAEKATGFLESREIPVLMKIMKGSFINKLIIMPVVFILQAIYAPAIKIILVIGGLYLAYEGVEKIIEFIIRKKNKKGKEVIEEIEEAGNEGEDAENEKVKSAIRTDFILSLEIVIIALGTVLDRSLAIQLMTVGFVCVLATVGVYGIVALIVRMDDAGYKIISKAKKENGIMVAIGNFLVNALPWVIKGLGVLGTIALVLVAGGIFDHNIDFLHHALENIPEVPKQALYGTIGGLLMIPIVAIIKKALGMFQKA